MPELAYTTVMTTLNRLAEKGILRSRPVRQQRAHEYTAAMTPATLLATGSRQDVGDLVKRYGDAALAAFAARLDGLEPDARRRLRELSKQ
jgi:predicted transcriptional regulator